MADTQASIMEIDETAKAQEEAGNAATASAATQADPDEDKKRQVSLMLPVGLLVRLELLATTPVDEGGYGVKTDSKGHTNISNPVIDAAVRIINEKLDPDFKLSPKQKAASGITLTAEEIQAKKDAEAAKRKEALAASNAAADALRAKLRAKAQAQLAS